MTCEDFERIFYACTGALGVHGYSQTTKAADAIFEFSKNSDLIYLSFQGDALFDID